VNISLSESDLQPLVEAVVALTLNKLGDERRQIGDKLAYSEPEAAALLSVRPHVLRDARLRGEIAGFKLGKGIRYAREELLRFLRKHQDFDR
jgi:Helix-turn-helix domain